MEIIISLWLPDITDWQCRQEEMDSMYTNLGNVVRNILSTIRHGVGVEASFSLVRDVIRWRQSKTTGDALYHKVLVR